MAALVITQYFCLLVICGGVWVSTSIQGQVQNFIVSYDTLYEEVDHVSLQEYGGILRPKIALTSVLDSTSEAWLCFIPTSGPNSTASSAYVLSVYLFYLFEYNEGAILWMANRNNPVSGNFSLTLDSTGDLVLLDGNGSLAWSSETSGRGVVGIQLSLVHDQSWGALQLTSPNGTTLWSSFDSPTDILMTEQSLQQGMPLVSWNSQSDPAEGPYSLVLEAGGLALYYSPLPELHPQPYWIWGFYGRNDTFGVTHTCNQTISAHVTSDGVVELEESDNPAPSNAWWPEFCSAIISKYPDLFSQNYGSRRLFDIDFLRLNPNGNLFAYTFTSLWAPVFDLFNGNLCLLPDYCGPYGVCTSPSNACSCPNSTRGSFPSAHDPSNLSLGCPPTHNLTCTLNSSSKNQRFEELIGVDYFSNKYSSPLNLSTQETCTDGCLQNCSCLAAFWHAHSNSCFHVDHHMGSLQGSLDSSYLAFLKVENVADESMKSSSAAALVGGVVSGVVALLVILCFLAIFMYRKWSAYPELEDEDPFLDSAPGLPTRYSYKELESITKGFSDELGKGGFGKVYAGVLQDGTKVAVKRLESLRQGRKEFRAEVIIMGGIHHHNLVGLIGFCAQGSHRLLVYEYMANGSLDQWLFRAEAGLGWSLRFGIALGAARGLAYLHEECKNTIIHLDIKPQNILLDQDFVAKVSDFGLSRLMGRDETHVVTTMRGTPGYLAPEWLKDSAISEKCDVFSFGMLLMEILGGRKNLNLSLMETEKVYFPAWVYHQVVAREGREVDFTNIAGVETPEEIRQARLVMNTAFLCVLENPSLRPSMVTVFHMLDGLVPILNLQLSDLFQGLHFALRMESTSAETAIEETLATLYGSSSALKPRTSHSCDGGVMSFAISAR